MKLLRYLGYLAAAIFLIVAFMFTVWYTTPYWTPIAFNSIASDYQVGLIELQSSQPTTDRWEIQHLVLELPTRHLLIGDGVILQLARLDSGQRSIVIDADKLMLKPIESKALDNQQRQAQPQPTILSAIINKLRLPAAIHSIEVNNFSVEYAGATAQGKVKVVKDEYTNVAKTTASFTGEIGHHNYLSNTIPADLSATIEAGLVELSARVDSVVVNTTLKKANAWEITGDFNINKARSNKFINVMKAELEKRQKSKGILTSLTIEGELSGNMQGEIPNNFSEDLDNFTLTIIPALTATAVKEEQGTFTLQGEAALTLSMSDSEPTIEITSQPWHVNIDAKSDALNRVPANWVLKPKNSIRCKINGEIDVCLSQKNVTLDFFTDESRQPESSQISQPILSKAKGQVSYDIQNQKGHSSVKLTIVGDGLKTPKISNVSSTFNYKKNAENWLVSSSNSSINAAHMTFGSTTIGQIDAQLTNTKIALKIDDLSKPILQTQIHVDSKVYSAGPAQIAKHIQWPIDLSLKSEISVTEKSVNIAHGLLNALGTKIQFDGSLTKKLSAKEIKKGLPDWRNHEGNLLLLAELTSPNTTVEKLLQSLIQENLQPENFVFHQGSLKVNGAIDWKLHNEKQTYSAQVASSATDWNITVNKINLKNVGATAAFFIDNSIFELTSPLALNITEINIGVPIRNVSVQLSGAGQTHMPFGCMININKAQGNLFGGAFRLARAFVFDCTDYHNQSIRQTAFVEINQLDLEELVKLENEDIVAKGEISGLIPITLTHNKMIVNGGQVSAINPGYIKLLEGESWKSIAGENESFLFAINALENFHYKSLVSRVDYLENDQLTLGISLQGANPNVHKGKEIIYNLNIETNVLSLLKSIELADDITEKLSKEYR